jgi:hypothetical protein
MRVRHLIDTWRQRLHPVHLFIGYRWLAWLIAGIALTLPGRAADSWPLNASLLLITLLVVLFITRQAQHYLQLMQRRPVLLAGDVLLGWLVLILSGHDFLPFGPHALGSLIAPALIFGWRGALIGGVGGGILFVIGYNGVADGWSSMIRIVLPVIFALVWAALAVWCQPPPDRLKYTGEHFPRSASPPANPSRSSLTSGETVGRSTEWYPPSFTSTGNRTTTGLASTVSLRPDLQLAISQLVDVERQRGGLQVECRIEGTTQRLTVAQQMVLIRAAQEALSNVRRHAHASSCEVWLRVDDQAATLQIQDDGVGLLDGTYERPHLHALRALRYRVAELDGQLAVFEGERGGLIVRVTLPLDS